MTRSPRTTSGNVLGLSREGILRSTPNVALKKHRPQLALLALDASESMTPHVGALGVAVASFVAELAKPENRNLFEVAALSFNSTAQLLLTPTPAATAVVPSVTPNDVTNIAAALELAERTAHTYQADKERQARRSVIVLLTDGKSNVGDPLPVAARLREHFHVATIGFGDDADFAFLERIVTAPALAVRAADAASLRGAFVHIGATVSQALQTPLVSLEEVAQRNSRLRLP